MSTTETLTLDTLVETPAPTQAPEPERIKLDALETPAQKRDAGGKFAKAETEDELLLRLAQKHGLEHAPAAGASADTEPSEGKPAEVTADPKAKGTPAQNRARKALEYDGWDASDLEALPEERILALGEKAAKRQADIANKLRAASAKTKQDGEAKTEEAAESGSAEPAQPHDLKTAFKPFLDELALDEKTSSAFVDAISKAISPMQEELQALRMERFAGEVETARKELTERFPQLAEDDEFAEALADAQALAAGLKDRGRAQSVLEVFEHVARMRYPQSAEPKSPSKSQELDRKRDQGQPRTATRAMSTKGMSKDDRERAVIDYLEKHPGDRAGAARIMRGE